MSNEARTKAAAEICENAENYKVCDQCESIMKKTRSTLRPVSRLLLAH